MEITTDSHGLSIDLRRFMECSWTVMDSPWTTMDCPWNHQGLSMDHHGPPLWTTMNYHGLFVDYRRLFGTIMDYHELFMN